MSILHHDQEKTPDLEQVVKDRRTAVYQEIQTGIVRVANVDLKR